MRSPLLIDKLNVEGVRITFNNLDTICLDKPLSEQLYVLKEDLLQLEIGEDYLIDVGYYPEFSLDGEFKVLIIKGNDWSEPFRVKSCKTPELLIEYVQEAINEIVKK